MRVTISLNSQNKSEFFPYNYHEYIQAAIYKNLPEPKAKKLHEQGFPYEKRQFRLFTFSRLQGRRERRNRNAGLSFYMPVSFIIASPIDWILQGLAENLLRNGKLQLGRADMQVESIAVHAPVQFGEQVKIRMLSLVTVYSTLQKPDGKKLTHYYTPYEGAFGKQIEENLRKKFALLYQQPNGNKIKITSLSRRNGEHVLNYKGTVIKGWDGNYLLQGDPELIAMAYHCGLGAKNSQGFGLWEVAG